MPFNPTLGAIPEADGTRFRVWAPEAKTVELVLNRGSVSMNREAEGTFSAWLGDVGPGKRYRYRVDGGDPFPDPCSRFQPEGVHGPSQVVDPTLFAWMDQQWKGRPLRDLVVYELHVGTFSPEGTFQGTTDRLPYLRDLGVTAIELMPVADFPGMRNWGYDGVSLFAPARCYGSPDDLRLLVDRAHSIGLCVLMDVVYNHFGPDGNYTGVYSPYYVSQSHSNPWGAGLNFDGPHSEMLRRTFIENAQHWIHEYHCDGLRLDATHAIVDESERHFLTELTAKVKDRAHDREVVVIAEDHRNLARMMRPESAGGCGLDGVWADDFHHEVRSILAGDDEGYYADFRGSAKDLATILNQGWLFTGQHSSYLSEPRGSDPAGLKPESFVICIQNHDQIGNRAFGDRLHHECDPGAYRAASALLLLSPQTPMLFQGQEWATTSPFQFFTDHNPELGKLVTEGRRREFQAFQAFSDPAARERIPDPQSEQTFANCRLDWDEVDTQPHAGTRELYKRLLELRTTVRDVSSQAEAAGDDAVILRRGEMTIVALLRGSGSVAIAGEKNVVMTTEDDTFVSDGQLPGITMDAGHTRVEFTRPGAVILTESRGV